jgi:hypothetical protein
MDCFVALLLAMTAVAADCIPSDPEYDGRKPLPARGLQLPLDTDKIDDTALALLYLTLHDGDRAWKGFAWSVLGRLHEKGMIYDPVGKVKSVVFTPEGQERAKELFETMFKKRDTSVDS